MCLLKVITEADTSCYAAADLAESCTFLADYSLRTPIWEVCHERRNRGLTLSSSGSESFALRSPGINSRTRRALSVGVGYDHLLLYFRWFDFLRALQGFSYSAHMQLRACSVHLCFRCGLLSVISCKDNIDEGQPCRLDEPFAAARLYAAI